MNKTRIGAYNAVFNKGVEAGMKQASKFVSVWLVLALREEPFKFGAKRIQKVLDALHKYSGLTIEQKTDITEQIEYIRKTTGINILLNGDDFAYTIDTVDEDYDFKEED